MKITAILLLILGVLGLILSTMMFGDIGIATMVGSLAAILSGFGFFSVNKAIYKQNAVK
ncbi:hypothetical protein [Exiguobacterium mexicanum]|uniref:hypothetical protein n=1 Tax=Exiguobacterium mexicanum TaxID=340146 RepID=UPI00384EE566